jgi:hypothetical protein
MNYVLKLTEEELAGQGIVQLNNPLQRGESATAEFAIKRSYNMVSNPDSITSRANANAAGSGEYEDEQPMQANGAEIAKRMDFDEEPRKGIRDAEPLSFMDIVMQAWGASK